MKVLNFFSEIHALQEIGNLVTLFGSIFYLTHYTIVGIYTIKSVSFYRIPKDLELPSYLILCYVVVVNAGRPNK